MEATQFKWNIYMCNLLGVPNVLALLEEKASININIHSEVPPNIYRD